MAEGVGFEPTWGDPKRFSRPPRYDRFDNPPYSIRCAKTLEKTLEVHRFPICSIAENWLTIGEIETRRPEIAQIFKTASL